MLTIVIVVALLVATFFLFVRRPVFGIDPAITRLERWGVPANKTTELDWWEGTTLPSDVKITATPARHISGRSFARGRTLGSSFVLDLPGYRIFFGGDSGYDKTFKELGESRIARALGQVYAGLSLVDRTRGTVHQTH
ncbi:MAG: hypothetical protein LH609_21610 [Rudanella sp.]|nr:hypothetical protein [Rudanella sp.]